MNDLNILKEVGLKEVARKTHIEPEFLQHFIDRDYAKLSRVNVAGYIKILQREYSLDLTEWFNEYKEYQKANQIDENERTTVNPKFEGYTADGSTQRISGSSLGWLLWVFIVIGFIIASYFFDAHKYIEQIPNMFEDKNRSATYSDSSVVVEVKKSMNIVEENTSIPLHGKNTDKNLSVLVSLEPQIQLQKILNEQDDTKEELDQNTTQATDNDVNSDKETSIDNKDTKDSDKSSAVGTFVGRSDSAIIVPKTNVWIGTIDLKTGKKVSTTTSKEYKMNLKNDYLIACGNGNIVVKINGESKKFDPAKAARFLVKNGEIRFLTYDEFVSLNGGKSW